MGDGQRLKAYSPLYDSVTSLIATWYYNRLNLQLLLLTVFPKRLSRDQNLTDVLFLETGLGDKPAASLSHPQSEQSDYLETDTANLK